MPRSSRSAFLRTLGAALVPQLVRTFAREHPNVRFAFAQNNGAALEAMLLAGDVALTLVVGPPAHPALHWERVTTQRLVLIVPPDHRLAQRTSVKLAELRDETFLSFKPGHACARIHRCVVPGRRFSRRASRSRAMSRIAFADS